MQPRYLPHVPGGDRALSAPAIASSRTGPRCVSVEFACIESKL